MTTHKSDAIHTQSPTSSFRNAVQHGGKLRIDVATYTAKGTEVVGDEIEICKLKKGMKIIPHLSFINGDEGSSVKFEIVGFTNSSGVAANAYSSLSAVATKPDFPPLSEDMTLKAKISGAAMTTGKKVIFSIVYCQL